MSGKYMLNQLKGVVTVLEDADLSRMGRILSDTEPDAEDLDEAAP